MKRSKLSRLFLLIVFTVHFGCNTHSQTLQTGIYDIGAIAINREVITGFIEDGIGDEAHIGMLLVDVLTSALPVAGA